MKEGGQKMVEIKADNGTVLTTAGAALGRRVDVHSFTLLECSTSKNGLQMSLDDANERMFLYFSGVNSNSLWTLGFICFLFSLAHHLKSMPIHSLFSRAGIMTSVKDIVIESHYTPWGHVLLLP